MIGRWDSRTRTETLMILALLLASGLMSVSAQKTAGTPPSKEVLDQFVDKHFARWDRNHDGVLELDEVERKVEDPFIRGREAAVIFRIRQHLTVKGNQPCLPREELLSLRATALLPNRWNRPPNSCKRSTASCSCRPIPISPAFVRAARAIVTCSRPLPLRPIAAPRRYAT